jgi:hypothetical protein
MEVLRGGPGDLSLRLPCITRPTGYIPLGLCIHCVALLVGYPPTPSFGGFGRARVFFLSILYFLLFNMIKIFKSKFERLGYHVFHCLVWAAISESGFYPMLLFLGMRSSGP